jgi:hypothetical protein
MVTWEGDDDLFDDFEEFYGVDFGLEFFDEFGVEIEADLAFNLRVEKEGENGDWKFVPEPEIKRGLLGVEGVFEVGDDVGEGRELLWVFVKDLEAHEGWSKI